MKGYSLINQIKIQTNYPNENEYLWLGDHVWGWLRKLESYASDSDAEKKRKEMIELCKNIKEGVNSSIEQPGEVIHHPMACLCRTRVYCRIESIMKNLEKGTSVDQTFKPYLLKESIISRPSQEFRSAQLFLEAEATFNNEYIKLAFKNLSQWHERKPNLSIIFHWKEAFEFLIFSCTDPHQFVLFLLSTLKSQSLFRDRFKDKFESILRLLPDTFWDAMVVVFLGNEDNLEYLIDRLDVCTFLDVFSEKEKASVIVLEHLKMFSDFARVIYRKCKMEGTAVFFGFIKKLSLAKCNFFETTILGMDAKDDYFRAMLMQGFDYASCVDGVCNDITEYSEQLTLMFYEALLRDDNSYINQLLNCTKAYAVEKEKRTQKSQTLGRNSLFDTKTEKQKLETEKTKFERKISYNLQGLSLYMWQKHKITKNLKKDEQELYFIKHFDQFEQKLLALEIIDANQRSEFRKNVCSQLSLKLNNDVPMVDVTPNENELLQMVKSLTSKNKEHEERIKTLESQVSKLMEYIENYLPHSNSADSNCMNI